MIHYLFFTGIKTHNLVRKFIKIEPAFLSWKSEAKLHYDWLFFEKIDWLNF